MKRSDAQAALVLKALGEPRRIQILRLLHGAPRAVGEIAADVDIWQQVISQHLAVLERAGLVEARREGTRSIYTVRRSDLRPWRHSSRASGSRASRR